MSSSEAAGLSVSIIFIVLLVIVATLFGLRAYNVSKSGKTIPHIYDHEGDDRNWFKKWIDPYQYWNDKGIKQDPYSESVSGRNRNLHLGDADVQHYDRL
jgi:hypothetical protein